MRRSAKGMHAATRSQSADEKRGAEDAHAMRRTPRTRDASSSVSANVAVEKSQVFGGEAVSGGYDVGGTQLRTSHLPTQHDLNQLPSVVASQSSCWAMTV